MNDLFNISYTIIISVGLLIGIVRGIYVCAVASKSDVSPVMVIGRVLRFPIYTFVLLLWASCVLPFTFALAFIYLAVKTAFYPLVPLWCFIEVLFGIFVHDSTLATGFTKSVAGIYSTYWDRAPKLCSDLLRFGLKAIEHFAAYGFS